MDYPELPSEMAADKEKTFDQTWIESSYLETLLPSTPWQNINDILCSELAQVVRQQFNNPQRKQMIIELVGSQFKRSYLTDEVDNPSILNPPSMSHEQRKKLENEAKSWLQIQINDIALKKKAALKSDQVEDELSSEMKDYLEHTYNIVSTNLDRHLLIKQKQLKSEGSNKANKISSQNDLRDILRSKNDQLKNSQRPNLSGEYSEFISESILSILKKDPRRIAFVLQKLIGQQLTINLRQFIWSDILLRHERKKIDISLKIDIDLLVRKNFASGVTRGKNELKLNDPSQTQVSGLIENAVIETYSRVHSLNQYLNEQHLRQTMKILNVLYTYSRDYEPYYIYWLLPFQLTFTDEKNNKSELIYDLAMYLDLFVKNLFPDWNEIFTIAGKIMQDLYLNDPVFFEHLKKISKINPKINQKDFVNEIINNESKKSVNHLVNNQAEVDLNFMRANKELLTEPVIFIRKWIGEAYSGILRKNSLLYVWDQLFISLWSSNDFELITKSILYLLRGEFMNARDHDQMRKVFLESPCQLLTSDIQSAFMHLSTGRKENEVAFLNRTNRGDATLNGEYYARPDNSHKSLLEPFIIKDIYLKLIIPKFGLTADFDPSRVRVEISIYYGETRLVQKQTQSIPLVKDIKSSQQDTKLYEIALINDKLLFDLANFNHDPNNTSRDVYALVVVKYQSINSSDIFLGFCKFALYSAQKIGSVSTWEFVQGEITRYLHSGVAPQNLQKIDEYPKTSYKDRLGPGSCVKFTLLDQNYIKSRKS